MRYARLIKMELHAERPTNSERLTKPPERRMDTMLSQRKTELYSSRHKMRKMHKLRLPSLLLGGKKVVFQIPVLKEENVLVKEKTQESAMTQPSAVVSTLQSLDRLSLPRLMTDVEEELPVHPPRMVNGTTV